MKRRLTLVLGLAAIAAAFFALNCLTPYYGDDYSYMFTYAADAPKERITSLYGLWLSQLNHYRVMNGRAIVHTLVQLFLMPEGKLLFNVCNTLVFMALGFAVYYAAYGTLRAMRPLSLFAVYALVWLALPDFGQSCLWLTGSINYMWTVFAALCFLLPYRADAAGRGRAWLRVPGMFLLGVLAGWSGENACISAAVGVVLLLARRRLLGLGVRAWHWAGLAGFLAGAAALFLAPAQALKADNMGGLGGLSTWISRIPSVSYHALKYLWLPLAIGLVLLALSIVQSRGKGFGYWLKKYSAAVIWLCAAVVSAYCMCAAPYFPERAWCAAAVFAAATLLAVRAELDLPARAVRLAPAAAAVIAAACAVTFALGARDLAATGAAVRARSASAAEQLAAGETELYLPAVCGYARCNCFTPDGDITSDQKSWQNKALATYFGAGSVNLID